MVSTVPLTVIPVSAAEEFTTEDGFTYTVSNDEATITNYTGSETNLVIPADVDGYPVVAIGSYSMRYNKTWVSIDFTQCADTLTTLGSQAFYGCTALQSIDFSGCTALTTFGNGAFSSCSALVDIHIPDLSVWCNIYFSSSVTNQKSKLWLDGNLITDLVIPEGVTEIPSIALMAIPIALLSDLTSQNHEADLIT